MKMGKVTSIDIGELAAGYDDKRRIESTEFNRLLGWILHYGKVGGRVLEIGCGTGFYLVPLARRLPETRCYGIDITDAMLIQAKAKAKEKGRVNCFLAKADAHYLPFKEDGFDFVLMSQVLHYFQDLHRVAADVHRISISRNADPEFIINTSNLTQIAPDQALVNINSTNQLNVRPLPRIPDHTTSNRATPELHCLSFGHHLTSQSVFYYSTRVAFAIVRWYMTWMFGRSVPTCTNTILCNRTRLARPLEVMSCGKRAVFVEPGR